jgi:hypothetical protein
MRLIDLFEAPISDITHIGDWDRNSSFRHPQDRKLLTNPKALTKMRAQWRFPEETMFNIILVNHPDGQGTTETGFVTHDWIAENMPRISEQVEDALDHDALNIIFTNNSGGQRVPMTGWIMAHRLGHALEAYGTRARGKNFAYYYHEADELFQKNTKQLVNEFYGVQFKPSYSYGRREQHDRFVLPRGGHPVLGFLRAACTFRSARENNIREGGEVVHESLAQYMFTGKVRFGDIPKSFKYGNSYYFFKGDEDEYAYANMMFRETGEQMADYFETALNYCVGQIFVM